MERVLGVGIAALAVLVVILETPPGFGQEPASRNSEPPVFRDAAEAWGVGRRGFNASTRILDLDGDGRLDVLTGGSARLAVFYGEDVKRFDLSEPFDVSSSGFHPADYDGDGLLDVYIGNFLGGRSIQLDLRMRPRVPAIAGTHARLHASGSKRVLAYRQVMGFGTRANPSPWIHFGVPEGESFDVVVTFPGGVVVRRDKVKPGAVVRIVKRP